MKELSIGNNTLIAGVGLVLGILIVAVLVPNAFQKSTTSNFIGVVDLAEKIKNREELNLIDLRSESEFDDFHLPTAINVLPENMSPEILQQPGQTIIYSGSDMKARKYWNSLPDSLKSKCFVLYGGAYDWYTRLLYPKLPSRPSLENKRLTDEIYNLCIYYGGLADFTKDEYVLEYYKKDLSDESWPRIVNKVGLVRKGC